MDPPEVPVAALTEAVEAHDTAKVQELLGSLKEAGFGKSEVDAALRQAIARHSVTKPTTTMNHRERPWRETLPGERVSVLWSTQHEWAANHPQPALLLKRHFPTTRSDAIKIKFGALTRFEKVVPKDFRETFEHALQYFPNAVTRTLSYFLLNYLAHYRDLIVQNGRTLCVVKCYISKEESHIWFMPLEKVKECLNAQSDSLRQGISHNDLQLVQSYPVRTSLAIHAETWQSAARGTPRGRGGASSSYGEITWVGGNAMHYATDDGATANEQSEDFARLSVAEVEKLSARKEAIRQRGRAVLTKDFEDELEAEEKQTKAEKRAARAAADAAQQTPQQQTPLPEVT